MPQPAANVPPPRFTVNAWSAWAPGIADAAAWRAWAMQPHLPCGDQRPDLAQYPMMLRRRAERLARMALHTVAEVRGATPCPMVYASHRGETARAVPLLRELAETGAVAPGPFSMSVHNAVSALESIAHADTGNYTALAAAGECAELAIVEALGLLADGENEVIVSVYDETVPDCYRGKVEGADAAFAWSWRVAAAGDGPGFELSWDGLGTRDPGPGTREKPAQSDFGTLAQTESRSDAVSENSRLTGSRVPGPASRLLPPALRILQFFLSDAESLTHDGSHCRWTWRRVA